MNLVIRVGVVSVAAFFAAVSIALLLAFAVSALGQPDGVERIVKVLVALAAGLSFFLVGRGIWRDLRAKRPSAPEGEHSSTRENGR